MQCSHESNFSRFKAWPVASIQQDSNEILEAFASCISTVKEDVVGLTPGIKNSTKQEYVAPDMWHKAMDTQVTKKNWISHEQVKNKSWASEELVLN